jgi:hypothetical protein
MLLRSQYRARSCDSNPSNEGFGWNFKMLHDVASD